MDQKNEQRDCAWLLVYSLRPKVVHLGTPCTKMCVLSQAWPNHALDEATHAQNRFTHAVMTHQHAEGLGASVENPRGSLLFKQKEFVKSFGKMSVPVVK